MAHPATTPDVTVEEYLKLEQASAMRHEFVGGQLYAQAGGSERHNRIAGNIFALLLPASRGSACRVFIIDMKLRADASLFYYPDVMVVCDPADAEPYFKTRPCLVVEVLSRATEMIDRREKLHAYRRLPSLEAYVLVNQDEPRIEVYRRAESGGWRYEVAEGEATITLPRPLVELAVRDVYAGLESTPPAVTEG